MKFDFGLEQFLSAPNARGRVGLISNATGIDRHGTHVAFRIASHGNLRLQRLFSPEHGFWSDAPDGEAVGHGLHTKLNLPIVSLYGDRRIPQPEDLAGLDLLVYDIQDVGVRFYTYISTLRNIIDAAAMAGAPVHILDRPNLIGGTVVEGPALAPGFESFVGHLPVPIRYGLTPGELALWYNSKLKKPADIKVWACRNYHRTTTFSDLGVPWVKPSPSMTSASTATFYPGTCLFEGTNVSEGRGTEAPFQILGAPWVNPALWLAELLPKLPPEVSAREASFRPAFGKFEGKTCRGIRLNTTQSILLNAVGIGIRAIQALIATHAGEVEFLTKPQRAVPFFDFLAGNSWLREGLLSGTASRTLEERANLEASGFSKERESFFLYP